MQRRNDVAFVTDVDGTLTPKSYISLTLLVDHHALPTAARAEVQRLRDRYIPLAMIGKLPHEDEMLWLKETFRIYAECRMTRQAWQAALDGVELREGAVETLAALAASGVPTAAISYGCADFIEYVLARHGVRVDAVYAGRMIYEGDFVAGVEEASLVIPAMKGECSRHFADTHGVPHDALVGAGDSGGDRSIGHLRESRIFLADTEEEAARLRGLGFAGEVHVASTYHPVRAFLRRRTGLPL